MLLLALLSSVGACKKYLDVTPDDLGTLEYAFRNRNEAENYLFGCYAYVQRMSDEVKNPSFTTSSEIIYPNDLTTPTVDQTGFNLLRGTQTSSNPGLNAWDGMNNNYSLFRSIRLCNTMLDNIDQPIDLTETEKKRWIAEAKFLKAYYHYCLARMYGPIPIIRENLAIDASPEEVRVKREHVDTVFNYCVRLLDEAAPDLPPLITNISRELGRATRPAAMTLKAEILTLAASPLFNGNPDYASFRDKEGQPLFASSFEAAKWSRAATACREAITECESRGIILYQFQLPANITSLSDSLKKVLTLQQTITEKWDENPEMIWANVPTYTYQGYSTPRMTSKSVVNIFSNPGTFAVPMATAELFYSDKGVPMSEDKTFNYSGRYQLRASDAGSKYYIRENYTTVNAHFNREPRFYADLAFDGANWFGNGVLDQNNMLYVEARGNVSKAGPKDRNRYNATGYWAKKTVSYQSVYDDGFQEISFHMPIMRLAALYLLYAEALNEAEGPVNDVFTYVDRVRARASLAGVQESWDNYSRTPTKYTTKEGMREIIHRERRIELCFESQSGWDLRRWKELQQVLSLPLQGWSIEQTEAVNYYRPRTVLTPVFGLRDYLWPIRDETLVINSKLVQNPYW